MNKYYTLSLDLYDGKTSQLTVCIKPGSIKIGQQFRFDTPDGLIRGNVIGVKPAKMKKKSPRKKD